MHIVKRTVKQELAKEKPERRQSHRILAELQKDGVLSADQAVARCGGIRSSARRRLVDAVNKGLAYAVHTETLYFATKKLLDMKPEKLKKLTLKKKPRKV